MTEGSRVYITSPPGSGWDLKWIFTKNLPSPEDQLRWGRSITVYDDPYYIMGISDDEAYDSDSIHPSDAEWLYVVDMSDDTPTVIDREQEAARGSTSLQGSKYLYSIGFYGELYAWEWEPGGSIISHGNIASVENDTNINPASDLTNESESRLWHSGLDDNTLEVIVASIDITFDSNGVPSNGSAQEEFYPRDESEGGVGIAYNRNNDTIFLAGERRSEDSPKDIVIYDRAGAELDRFSGPPAPQVTGLHYDHITDTLWAMTSGEFLRRRNLRLIQRDDHGRRINDTTSTSRQHNKGRIRARGTYW